MSNTIYFFVKFFSKKTHAENFLRGNLYSNRLAFFKKLEEDEKANRGDMHEAVVGWYQPDQIRLTLNDREIKDLAAPVSLHMNQHNDLNVFCIYAAHNGPFEEITDENISIFRDHLKISTDCQRLGDYAVVITQAKSFIQQVLNAVKAEGYGLKAGLVRYYDPSVFSGSFAEDEAVFYKRKEFEHQSEYRFSFHTDIPGDAALELQIGDISDIAVLCNSWEVNDLLQVSLPDGNLT